MRRSDEEIITDGASSLEEVFLALFNNIGDRLHEIESHLVELSGQVEALKAIVEVKSGE